LSGAEVAELFDDPCTFNNGSNLVSEWLFDDDAFDNNGSNDLTANNSPTFSTDHAYDCEGGGGGEETPPPDVEVRYNAGIWPTALGVTWFWFMMSALGTIATLVFLLLFINIFFKVISSIIKRQHGKH